MRFPLIFWHYKIVCERPDI